MDVEVDKALLERSMQKKAERSAMRERVAKLVDAGASRTEVLARLGISSGFYYRLLGEIRGARGK